MIPGMRLKPGGPRGFPLFAPPSKHPKTNFFEAMPHDSARRMGAGDFLSYVQAQGEPCAFLDLAPAFDRTAGRNQVRAAGGTGARRPRCEAGRKEAPFGRFDRFRQGLKGYDRVREKPFGRPARGCPRRFALRDTERAGGMLSMTRRCLEGQGGVQSTWYLL